MPGVQSANSIIEQRLRTGLVGIERTTQADALTYVGPLLYGIEDTIKYAVEDVRNRKQKLLVILETNGGYVEVAERIANTFRHHYAAVDFLVPNFAMSAGTVLVMSGDAILMDYSAILGPIDPQAQRPGSDQLVPAIGYLEEFDTLIQKSRNGDLTTAELTFMVENFDAAELYQYKQQRQLSIDLLKKWLRQYKFKNWARTETRGQEVDETMRTQRAEEIAKKLNNPQLWGSHGRGIPMQVLREDLNLKIDDFGEHPELGPSVRVYYRLLRDYMMRRNHGVALHTRMGYQGDY